MLRSAGMESSIILSLVLMLKTLVSVEATALAFPHLPANTIIPTKNIATRTNTPPTLLHEASGFWLVQLRLILHRFPMEVIEFTLITNIQQIIKITKHSLQLLFV